jgi:hypothetical protein
MKREGAKAMASKPTAQRRSASGNGWNGSNAAADVSVKLGTQRKRYRTGVLLRTLLEID